MLNLQWPRVRAFHETAWKHYEAATFLLGGCSPNSSSTRAAEAIYLGGYVAECGLKARLLSAYRPRKHPVIEKDFVEDVRHDLEKLRDRLERLRKPVVLPPETLKALRSLRRVWHSTLRYDPAKMATRDAVDLVQAAKKVLDWVGA